MSAASCLNCASRVTCPDGVRGRVAPCGSHVSHVHHVIHGGLHACAITHDHETTHVHPVGPCSGGHERQREELRALRKWHAQQCTQNRALAGRAAGAELSRTYNAAADKHLSFVQTLNGYFPVGDYEEFGQ